MNKTNNKLQLLSTSPVPKALLALGIPTMIGMMVNALYNLADTYFVAGLGTNQNGAISVAFPIGQIIVGLGLLFGNGAASYISRLLGKGQKDIAGKTASTAVYSSLFIGAVIIIITSIFLTPILKLLGATESILPYAQIYTRIYVISSIFNVFNVTMNNIVTSEGSAKTTMFALLSGAVLNVILDPIFIYTLDFGVAGAAIATAISQIISTLIYIQYILRKKSNFSFSIKECSFTKEIISEILKIGIPTLVFQILSGVSIAMVSKLAKDFGYGDSVIAAMGNVSKVISVGSLMVFGFIKGFQPIAGFSYGAGNYDRLKKSIKTSLLWSTGLCILFGISTAVFSTEIMSMFTQNDSRLIETGSKALIDNGVTFILFGFNTVFSSLFLAIGKATKGFILGACRQGLCFIPIVVFMNFSFGLNGIIYSQPTADVITAIITAIMAAGLYKEIFNNHNDL